MNDTPEDRRMAPASTASGSRVAGIGRACRTRSSVAAVRGVLVAVAVLALMGTACSSDDGPSAAEKSTTESTSTTTTTTRPLVWVAERTRETPVAGRYRQGIARDGD